MGNPSAAHEPSMEEILASIRQIISEDGEQAEDGGESPEDGNEPAMAEAAETELNMPAAAYSSEPSAEEADDSQPADITSAPHAAAAPAATPPAPQPEHRAEPTLRRQPTPAQYTQTHQSQAQQPVRTAAAATPAAQPDRQATGGGVMQAAPAAGSARRLLSPQADASVSGAFSALAHTILAQNARTLEDLVSEMLRPMLKDWLDDNLPPLVERLVKEEIERVSRGRH